ncbi:MAG: SPOR domain-containing protein, partial [Pseudomonadota bacterium]
DEVTGIPKSVIPQVEALENLDNVPDEATTGIASEALPAANPPDPVLPVQEPPVSPVRFATDGAFLVQIAALRSQEAADAAWTNAVADTPRLFDGAEKRIQRADLGAKGVFYRLRVGAFSTRDDAKLFCDTLKSGGRACIVVAG